MPYFDSTLSPKGRKTRNWLNIDKERKMADLKLVRDIVPLLLLLHLLYDEPVG